MTVDGSTNIVASTVEHSTKDNDMIPVKYTLQIHKGIPCVAFTTTDYGVPNVVTHYWPLVREPKPRRNWEHENGLEFGKALSPVGAGTFTDRDGMSCQRRSYELVDGGKTMPIHTTVEPAKIPKGARKVGIQWKSGLWQLTLKSGIREIIPAQFNEA